MGAPLLRAHFPRAFLDVNREPYQLAPAACSMAPCRARNISSMRFAAGPWHQCRASSPRIWKYIVAVFPVEQALERTRRSTSPYHATLRKLSPHPCRVRDVDPHRLHSCGQRASARKRHRPDFIIGDRYGTSAAAELSGWRWSFWSSSGYAVARNKPYAGGFHHGTLRPTDRVDLHACRSKSTRASMSTRHPDKKAGICGISRPTSHLYRRRSAARRGFRLPILPLARGIATRKGFCVPAAQRCSKRTAPARGQV
ncbi:hypothetical protein F2981_03315 [Sinorhizobium meliloti]|nr:hypothetical protein [Sinorhizobium meliloti]